MKNEQLVLAIAYQKVVGLYHNEKSARQPLRAADCFAFFWGICRELFVSHLDLSAVGRHTLRFD